MNQSTIIALIAQLAQLCIKLFTEGRTEATPEERRAMFDAFQMSDTAVSEEIVRRENEHTP